MTVQLGDLEQLTRVQWTPILDGHDGLVFAAGVAVRVVPPRPSGTFFDVRNVVPVLRMMEAARRVGIDRAVIHSSYMAILDQLHPEWHLAERNPYIQSRIRQSAEARDAAGPGFTVAVLGIPWVFGTTPTKPSEWGRAVPWLRGDKKVPLAVPDGGTAVVTAKAIGLASVIALENRVDADLAVAQENMSWDDLIRRLARAAGRPDPVHVKKAAALGDHRTRAADRAVATPATPAVGPRPRAVEPTRHREPVRRRVQPGTRPHPGRHRTTPCATASSKVLKPGTPDRVSTRRPVVQAAFPSQALRRCMPSASRSVAPKITTAEKSSTSRAVRASANHLAVRSMAAED